MRSEIFFAELARRKDRHQLAQIFLQEGAKAGRRHYLERCRDHGTGLDESSLNYIGYLLLSYERIAEAIAIFELAVESFPLSANTHDSLGEALHLAGQQARAFECYLRSLELDPGNVHGLNMLKLLSH